MSEAENKPENENEETSDEEKDPEELKKEAENLVKQAKEEFLAESREELELKFKEIDKDSNGFIDKEEAKNIMDTWLEKDEAKTYLTEDEVKEFLALYDTNNDGKIDLNEFINSMADLFAKSIELFTKKYVP